MKAARDCDECIKPVASESLALIAEIADAAEAQLSDTRSRGLGVVANINTFNSQSAYTSLSENRAQTIRNLETLCEEPVIARVVATNDYGQATTYFICRATAGSPPRSGAKVASYRSPIGRLASLPVGGELLVEKSNRDEYLEVVERAVLHPKVVDQGWDSIDSTLEGDDYGPVTVRSFRALVHSESGENIDVDLLDRLLADEADSINILAGIRRSIIEKMELRDQPILDQHQDSIFRLPLSSRLLIVGPPGSGKTTTLIRRLGQKLDHDHLSPDEARVVERARHDGGLPHEQSWMMFTPTELLKQYVKEAFSREGIPASDLRITTWSDYRRALSRNRLPILKTATSDGAFILKETLSTLQDVTMGSQVEWFEDFCAWQNSAFWREMDMSARTLRADPNASIAVLGEELSAIMADGERTRDAAVLEALLAAAGKLQPLIAGREGDSDSRIRRVLNLQVNRDRNFLDDLAAFINDLSDVPDEPDGEETEDEEEAAPSGKGRTGAARAFFGAMRAHARAEATKRSLSRNSRAARIVEWLGERTLPQEERLVVGQMLRVQAAARRLANPFGRYVEAVPRRYRRYRHVRQGEGRWYKPQGYASRDITPLEVDVILLAMLRAGRELIRAQSLTRHIAGQKYAVLQVIRDLYRNQIVVDEATDFSPVQLACMAELADPRTRSLFACGDFNQRITEWGTRSAAEMRWAIPDIAIKPIAVNYRHSRQLNELARQIVLLSGGEEVEGELPDRVNKEGVPPVLARGLGDHRATACWLAARIVEVEQLTGRLPSIAVLVNAEQDVTILTDELNQALLPHNIHAVACLNGQAIGPENDVRVFHVRHIKGLEFEAAFFISIDQLAAQDPGLFDKYLYVGATRAATYLGLSCAGKGLPAKIAALESSFVDGWAVKP
jgi:hypothetical protein